MGFSPTRFQWLQLALVADRYPVGISVEDWGHGPLAGKGYDELESFSVEEKKEYGCLAMVLAIESKSGLYMCLNFLEYAFGPMFLEVMQGNPKLVAGWCREKAEALS